MAAPDATTVVFTFKTPQSNFLVSQTLQVFGIQSPTALQKDKADTTPLKDNKYAQGQGESMVGTGPFMFKDWVAGRPRHRGQEPELLGRRQRGHLDQITFKPMGDSTAKLQALQSGGIDLAETISPADVATAKSSGLTIIDRGQSCNLGYLGLNQSVGGTPTIYANKDVRLAVAEALNKQGYIDAFYAGQGKVPQSWLPAATTGFKAESDPDLRRHQGQGQPDDGGSDRDQLKIDLYYPSNVVRPYMPDPKSLAQAIAGDLQAIGFTVNLKTEDWHGGYVKDATNGKLPMFLFGWTCDWAGADNFLYTAWFGYQGGKPNPQFRLEERSGQHADAQGPSRSPPSTPANADWGQVQDLLAADMPTVPIVNSTPPGAYTSKVHGFVGSGNAIEYFNTVWLSK